MEIGVAALSAPAGMITSSRPSSDISEPPAASMVAVDGEPTGVPTGVTAPVVVVVGDVGLVELQEIKMTLPHNARERLSIVFIFIILNKIINRDTFEDILHL